MDRREAVALFKELGAEHLVAPAMVLIEERKPDNFQLRIKGDHDSKGIEIFLKNRGFSFEESKDYLIIFS